MTRSVSVLLATATAILATATAAAGCSSANVDQIDVPSAGGDYFFWVAINDKGAPARLSPVFGLDGARIVFGGDPLFRLEPGEEGAVAITFTNADLAKTHPGFLADQAEKITVALAIPPPAAIRSDEHAIAPLPTDARMVTASGAGDITPITDKVTLSIPIDPEYCKGPSGTRLSRYGAREQLLSPDVVLPEENPTTGPNDNFRRFIKVFKLDADRLLAISHQLMFVVRRGEAIGTNIFRTHQVLPTSINVYGAALSAPAGNGIRTLLAAGEIGGRPGILELELDGDQIRFVRTATVVQGPAFEGQNLLDIIIDKRGNVVAVGEAGLVLTRARGETELVSRSPMEPPSAYIYRAIIDSNDPTAPHLLTETYGRILTGDALTNDWELFERNDRFDNRRFYALATSTNGQEQWAAGVNGSVFVKKPGERWEPIEIWVPPSFEPCAATSTDGARTFVSTIRAIALDEGAAYLAFSECNAMLRVERDGFCTTVLTTEGAPVMPANLDFWSIDIKQGELIVGGTNGLLYSIPSP